MEIIYCQALPMTCSTRRTFRRRHVVNGVGLTMREKESVARVREWERARIARSIGPEYMFMHSPRRFYRMSGIIS